MAKVRAKWGSLNNLPKIINYKLTRCYKIYSNEVMNLEENESIFCRLHDMFPFKTDNDHISIGCNLNDAAECLNLFLKRYRSCGVIKYDFPLIIMAFYLFSTKIETVLKFLLGKKDNIDGMESFTVIRKWANFIKHPKHFMYLTHHPFFNFENSQIINSKSKKAKLVIDTIFIMKFYSNDSKNEELSEVLKNSNPVLVIFPDIIKLTKEFCISANNFLDLIDSNHVFKQKLMDDMILKNFFENYEGY